MSSLHTLKGQRAGMASIWVTHARAPAPLRSHFGRGLYGRRRAVDRPRARPGRPQQKADRRCLCRQHPSAGRQTGRRLRGGILESELMNFMRVQQRKCAEHSSERHLRLSDNRG